MLFVGMDFGSHKTAASASNGVRFSMETAVGWPKDHVAKAMLGREVVFGSDVHQVRTALDVVRPFEKGALKYLSEDEAGISSTELDQRKAAARLILEEVIGKVTSDSSPPLCAVIGSPSRASASCKKLVMDAAQGILNAVLIVAEPFAVAYGMGRLSGSLVVDIGAGTIDICPLLGRYPTPSDQITIPLGGDWIDEKLNEMVSERYPESQFSPYLARDLKERHGFAQDDKATVKIPVNGCPTEYDLTAELRAACNQIIEPIVDGIREVVAKVDPEFQASLLDNVLLAGGGSQLKRLDRALEERLRSDLGSARVINVPDCEFAGSAGALKLAMSLPEDQWMDLQSADVQTEAA